MSAACVRGPESNTRQYRVVVTSTGGRGEVQFATERVATRVFVREGRYAQATSRNAAIPVRIATVLATVQELEGRDSV